MARVAAPIAATNEVVATPIIEATLTTSMTLSAMFARLVMKCCSARSALRNANKRPTRWVNTLISHQPMARVSTASKKRLPYSMIIGIHDSEVLIR